MSSEYGSESLRAAEGEPNAEARDAWLTFVVVGAGPTGVEMAGQIAELARDTLRRDFRTIDPRRARILLVEAADRVLTSFPPSLSAKAERSLQRLGVTVLTGRTVIGIDAAGVTFEGGEGGRRADRHPRHRLGCRRHRVRPRLQARGTDRSRA
jgi:NADH dehydrogenase